jgi:hypothetical protein
MKHGPEQPWRILIVEDNPGDQRLIQEALRETHLNHTSVVARHSVEALDYLFRRAPFETAPRPNLILLDLNKPSHFAAGVLFSAIGWIAKFWLGAAVLPAPNDVDADVLASIGGRDESRPYSA